MTFCPCLGEAPAPTFKSIYFRPLGVATSCPVAALGAAPGVTADFGSSFFATVVASVFAGVVVLSATGLSTGAEEAAVFGASLLMGVVLAGDWTFSVFLSSQPAHTRVASRAIPITFMSVLHWV